MVPVSLISNRVRTHFELGCLAYSTSNLPNWIVAVSLLVIQALKAYHKSVLCIRADDSLIYISIILIAFYILTSSYLSSEKTNIQLFSVVNFMEQILYLCPGPFSWSWWSFIPAEVANYKIKYIIFYNFLFQLARLMEILISVINMNVFPILIDTSMR